MVAKKSGPPKGPSESHWSQVTAVGRLGWSLGFVLSVLWPKRWAPNNLALDFEMSGTIAAMAGFALMYVELTHRGKGWRLGGWLAACAAAIAIGSGQGYRLLMADPANRTPSMPVMWLELVLFCVLYFCLFALLAYGYRHGAAFVLEKLGKIPVE